MSVTNNTQVGIPKVPGLSDTEQAVLSAIVAEAVRLGRWEFPFLARRWVVAAGLCSEGLPRQHPQVAAAIRRLDEATKVLVQRGFLRFERPDDDSARIWTIDPRRIRHAIARAS